MRGLKQFVSVVLAAGVSGFATQASAIMSAPDGWYLEGNAGSSSQSGKSYPGSASSSGVGGSANLGYKFIPYFAAEANYSLYPRTSVNNSAGTQAAKDKLYSFALALRGILPISNYGFELFARLGAAQVRSKVTIENQTAANALGIGNSSHSKMGLYWGGGASYYFMPELALNVQYARAQGSSSTGDMSLLSGGITFIFG